MNHARYLCQVHIEKIRIGIPFEYKACGPSLGVFTCGGRAARSVTASTLRAEDRPNLLSKVSPCGDARIGLRCFLRRRRTTASRDDNSQKCSRPASTSPFVRILHAPHHTTIANHANQKVQKQLGSWCLAGDCSLDLARAGDCIGRSTPKSLRSKTRQRRRNSVRRTPHSRLIHLGRLSFTWTLLI